MIRAALLSLLGLDAMIAEARADGRRDAERESRPRVGAWTEHAGSWSLFDARGQSVASVWSVGERGWWWWAARPFRMNARGEEAPSRAEAMAAVLAVLATWCDVSAAKVPVSVADCHARATMSDPVSPSGEGG